VTNYTYKDGEKMRWNILGVPKDESVLNAFPDLARMFEDMKPTIKQVVGLTPDQVIRYIVYVYHTKSPLVNGEENVLARKKAAMLLCGAKVDNKGFFSEQVNAIIANKSLPVIDLKMRFLRFENNIIWLQLCNASELWLEHQKIISSAISDDGKKTPDELMKVRLSTQKDSEVLEQKLEKLADKLFIGDIDLLNYVGSTVVREDIKARLTPEARASK